MADSRTITPGDVMVRWRVMVRASGLAVIRRDSDDDIGGRLRAEPGTGRRRLGGARGLLQRMANSRDVFAVAERVKDGARAGTHTASAPSRMTLAEQEALAQAVLDLRDAAGPMARLPYPVSADERTDWLTYQQRLGDLLARLGGDAATGQAGTREDK